MMDGLVVREVEISLGEWFLGPRTRYLGLERVQLILLTQVELVYKDGRVLVSVGVVGRIVHAARLALAIAAHDRAAIFLSRQAFPASFGRPLFHDLGQLYPLDRADLGKTRATDHKAARLTRLCNCFALLRHEGIIAYSYGVGRPVRIWARDRGPG